MKEEEILQLKEEYQKSDLARKGQILEYVAQDNDVFKLSESWDTIEQAFNFPRLEPKRYIEEVLDVRYENKEGRFLDQLELAGIEESKKVLKNHYTLFSKTDLSPIQLSKDLVAISKARVLLYFFGYQTDKDNGLVLKNKIPDVYPYVMGNIVDDYDKVADTVYKMVTTITTDYSKLTVLPDLLSNTNKYFGYWGEIRSYFCVWSDKPDHVYNLPINIGNFRGIDTSPKIIVPLASVISTPPKQEEKVVSETPKPKEMFVDNTKPLVPEQTSKKEEVEEVEEEQIETTNIEMDTYPLNYLESNFELALEKKYKTDYSPNDVFRFFEENKFLDNQNIFDNMGFFYDTDLTMFVEESNINMGLLQALSFIDVTLPPLEVIQNIERLDSLRGKVNTQKLYNHLVNNQQLIKTYPAFSKKNKEKLNLSTYNEAVRKLNSFGLEDPKYTFTKEYDVEGFLGEELLTSINDSAERQKQELLKLKESNETSIVSNTNESTKIQNLKQQEVKQSQTAVGESAPTKESAVASINTEAIKVGGSENLGSEPVNKNIAQSLGLGTILSGATEKMGVGTILSGATEALESPNDFGKGLIDTLKREGAEKLGQNNIATALSGVFGSKDIGSDLISGLLNNKGGEAPSPSTYLENNSINKTLVSELGKNVGINQLIENSDVIKGQTDVLNSVESKMNEISVLKSSIEELKSKVQTLDPTNMVGRAKENISSLVGSTVDDGSNNKVMSEEIKFNQGTPKGLESNKAVEDEIEDVVLDMAGLPNLPSFTPIGQKR